MILLFRLLTAIFFTVASLYYVWMFQLNGYFLKRSIKNLLNCPAFYLGVLFSVLQLAVNFLLPKVALYTNFAFAGLLSPFVFFAKKTPIKFTGRVCRWTIVLLLIFICGNLLLKTWFLTILILPLTSATKSLRKNTEFGRKKFPKQKCAVPFQWVTGFLITMK